ncbi:MFS general substrate transporter [Dacryopinax primogenitus]|uniref:MFS general substrate transporter n=1 Tax=Dacryopinax primogenitus (strain DJM 731) TaxID=1858805 RepID=M5GDA8_DACPD|nr:MFS general substrate transporter [Dacryopinax primogenitus]EJU06680.1 MFS general substrate transporter [Dacryopinax primogenitus]
MIAGADADKGDSSTNSAQEHNRDFGVFPIPHQLRHDTARPFEFSLLLNIVFAVTGTFTGANLYYCQPILIQLASAYQVDYDRIANVPTLTQAGYAAGLLLVTPLGDMVRRRELLFALLFCAGSVTLGLALTQSLVAFETLSFIAGLVAVTPQIIMPLTVDLAPAHKRGTALSIVFEGLLLGILVARVLGGVIAQFSYWRNIYWMSMGIHYSLLLILYFILPDVPDKKLGLSYIQILYTVLKFAVTEPVLIQSAIIGLCVNAVYASFWVTLTFLLGGSPYYYSTLDIGLFGLVGILGVATGPLVGKIVDRLNPWFGVLFGILGLMLTFAIDTAAATRSIGAIVVVAFLIDVFDSMQQVSSATRYFAINADARARINAVYIIAIFLGQFIGTSAGTRIFTAHGNYANGGMNLAWVGLALVVLLARGPVATTWLGWSGPKERWLRDQKSDQSDGKSLKALHDAEPPEPMVPITVAEPEINTETV